MQKPTALSREQTDASELRAVCAEMLLRADQSANSRHRHATLRAALRCILGFLQLARAEVWLPAGEGRPLICPAMASPSPSRNGSERRRRLGRPASASSRLARRVWLSRRVMCVGDVQTLRIGPPLRSESSRLPRAALGIPVAYRGRVVAVLLLFRWEAGDWPPAMRRQLESLAAQFGLFLHRHAVEEQLARSQARLSRALEELASVEETERSRLAEMLHDSVAQVLSLSRMKVNLLLKQPAGADRRDDLARLGELLDETISETRSLVGEASPAVLREQGLAQAIRCLTATFEQTYGMGVQVKDDGRPDRAAPGIRNMLYKAVRELLVNVRKHAGSQQATVTVREKGDWLFVRVEDHGQGFMAARLQGPSSNGGGFGLKHIRERCHDLGGNFKIHSTPGAGTRASMLLPLRSPSRYV